jgi:hypothetical protein
MSSKSLQELAKWSDLVSTGFPCGEVDDISSLVRRHDEDSIPISENVLNEMASGKEYCCFS